MPQCCSVVGCSAQEKRDGVTLFPAPASMKDRSKWIAICNRPDDWQPISKIYLCDRHFVDKKPTSANPYPTLNPPKIQSLSRPVNSDKISSKKTRKIYESKSNKLLTQFCYNATDPEPIGIEKGIVPLPKHNGKFYQRSVKRSKSKATAEIGETEKRKSKSRKPRKRKKIDGFQGVEKLLTDWFKKETAKNTSVTFEILKKRAEELASECDLALNEEFYKWLDDWRNKHEVDTESAEATSAITVLDSSNEIDDEVEDEVVYEGPVIRPGPSSSDAMNALDVLRRFLGRWDQAEVVSLMQVEEEVSRLAAHIRQQE